VNVGNPAKLIVINKPTYMSMENGSLWNSRHINTGNCHFAEPLNYKGLVYRGYNLASFCSNVQTSPNLNLYHITLPHPSYRIRNIPDSPDCLQVPFSSNITMFF
jgi:hypothetical protein